MSTNTHNSIENIDSEHTLHLFLVQLANVVILILSEQERSKSALIVRRSGVLSRVLLVNLGKVMLVNVTIVVSNGSVDEPVRQTKGIGVAGNLVSNLLAVVVHQLSHLVNVLGLQETLSQEETRVLLNGPQSEEVGEVDEVRLDVGLRRGVDSLVEGSHQVLSGVDLGTLESLLRQLLKGLVGREAALGELDKFVSGPLDGAVGDLLPGLDENLGVLEVSAAQSSLLKTLVSQVADRRAQRLTLSVAQTRLDETSAHGQTQDVVVTLPGALDNPVGVGLAKAVVARVAVATAGLSALVNDVGTGPGGEGLETSRRGKQLLEVDNGLAQSALVLRVDGLQQIGGLIVLNLGLVGGHLHGVGEGQKRQQTSLMVGVVDDLSLGLAGGGAKLSSHTGVSQSNGDESLGDKEGVGNHGDSAANESAVGELGQRRLRHLAGRRDLGVLHEHVLSGDSHIGELDPAVVDGVSAHLLSNVAESDAGHERVRRDVSQLDNKDLDAVVLAVDKQTSKAGGVGGRVGGSSNPPLGGSSVGGVDDELVRVLDVGGGGLKTGHVGAMAQLGHSKAAVEALDVRGALSHPVVVLLLGAGTPDGAHEQARVHTESDSGAHVHNAVQLGPQQRLLFCVLLPVAGQRRNSRHGRLSQLLLGHVVVARHVEHGVSLELRHQSLDHGHVLLATVQKLRHVLDGELDLGSLAGERLGWLCEGVVLLAVNLDVSCEVGGDHCVYRRGSDVLSTGRLCPCIYIFLGPSLFVWG
jgi:hypothetical protein